MKALIILILTFSFLNGFSQEKLAKPKVVDNNAQIKKIKKIKKTTTKKQVEKRYVDKKPEVNYNNVDSDGDGINDANDECPDEYGSSLFNGCSNAKVGYQFESGADGVYKRYTYGENNWGFYSNDNGNISITAKYQDANDFFNGLAIVKKNGKWGYIDINDTIIIPFEYDIATPFVNGLATVKKNGKIGYIDKQNKIVIPFIYDAAGDFYENLTVVKRNGYWGAIDKTGTIIIQLKFSNVASNPFNGNGIAEFYNDKIWKTFDNKGDCIKNCDWGDVRYGGVGSNKK